VISYNVASFTDIRDKKLEDVIAKMPGMAVSTSFTYNGTAVSRVFVNGSFNRTNMNQELLSQSKYTDNYYISGYVPVAKDFGFPKYLINRLSFLRAVDQIQTDLSIFATSITELDHHA